MGNLLDSNRAIMHQIWCCVCTECLVGGVLGYIYGLVILHLFFSILQTQYKFVYMTIMEYVNKVSTSPSICVVCDIPWCSVHQHPAQLAPCVSVRLAVVAMME